MQDGALWCGMLVAAATGLLAVRFNPATLYRRTMLIRLAVLAVLGIGAVFVVGFFSAPARQPSGITSNDF